MPDQNTDEESASNAIFSKLTKHGERKSSCFTVYSVGFLRWNVLESEMI